MKKKIKRIQYQVTYPDLNGNPISRVECWLDTGNDSGNKRLQLASWVPTLKYNCMRFDFMKSDKLDANLIIRRTAYFPLTEPETSTISLLNVNTTPEDVKDFKVIDKSATISVHNKIAVRIGNLGLESKFSNAFQVIL